MAKYSVNSKAWVNLTNMTGLKRAVVQRITKLPLHIAVSMTQPSNNLIGDAVKYSTPTAYGDGGADLWVRAVKGETTFTVLAVEETPYYRLADPDMVDAAAQSAALGDAGIAGAGTTRLVDGLKLAISNGVGWSTLPSITPFPRTRTGIIRAIELLRSVSSSGVLLYEDAVYDMEGGNLQGHVYSGISHIGAMPVLANDGKIVDTSWTIVGGTRFTNAVGAVFTGNNVDKAQAGNNYAADGIYGAHFQQLGFINCDAFDIGATNRCGLAMGSSVKDIYIYNPATWGANFENFIQCEFRKIFVALPNATNGLRFAATVDKDDYIPGNSTFEHIYVYRARANSRQIVFEAIQGSTLNEILVNKLQANAYGPTESTATATLTNGSADITLSTAANFLPGMPIVFTSTVGGFTINWTYYIVSVNGSTIQVSTRPGGNALTSTASTTATVKTKGYPGLEIHGLGSTDYGSIMHSEFKGLDIETETHVGVSGSMLINSFIDIVESFSSHIAGVVLRNASNVDVVSHKPIVTDFDYTSGATTSYTGKRDTWINSPGIGNWVTSDGLTAVSFLRCAGASDSPDFTSKNQSGVANYVMPTKPWCQQQAYMTGNASLTVTGNGGRTNVFSGSAAAIWGLPAINANGLGFQFRLVNAGSATLTVNSAGELFNQVASKTSYTLAPGQYLVVETAKTSAGTLFWAVVGGNAT